MHWPIRSPEAWDATNERPASLYQSQNPGCTRLIWSHTIQHFPWHHKNAETRIRNEGEILSCGKIEIYLIGQIYPTGTDHVSTQFIVETHLLPGEKSGNFLRDGQLPGQETKKMHSFKHTHCEWWSQFSRSQDTRRKSLGQGTYKGKPEQTQVYKKDILTILVSCQIESPKNTFLTMETLILCINLNTRYYISMYD